MSVPISYKINAEELILFPSYLLVRHFEADSSLIGINNSRSTEEANSSSVKQ